MTTACDADRVVRGARAAAHVVELIRNSGCRPVDPDALHAELQAILLQRDALKLIAFCRGLQAAIARDPR